MKKTILFLAMSLVLSIGCNKYDDDIASIEERLEKIEGTALTTINQQITAINVSMNDLKAVDTQLNSYITALQTTADDLKSQIDATNTALAALESDLEGQITASEQKVLNELNTVKEALEAQLAAINNTIATLQAKDAELDRKIADLQKYVDDEITATEDWASATFSTLEQYEATQTAISEINALIKSTQESIAALETKLNKKIADDIAAAVAGVNADIAAKVTEITSAYTEAIAAAKDDITAAYTDAIKTAITASETSMKEWVNSVLAEGYYTKAKINGKITALTTQVTDGDKALQDEIDALEAALAKAESDLTSAYKKTIKDAITENNGKLSAEIASAVKAAKDKLQAQIDAINDEIDKIKARLDIIEADINSINQQIAAINGSIDDLKAVDAALQTLIDDLEAEAANLQAELEANAEADAATKKALEDRITALETLIATLQAKDAELDQKITDLKTYVDNELANYATTDWANATFATLTQYLEIQTTIEAIKAEIKDDYTAAIKAAVNALEDKMEDWVNKKLEQPLKDIAALQAALSALTNDVVTDEELADAVAAQKEALEKAVENLTAAYEKAIEDAVAEGGVINNAIAQEVQKAQDALQSKIDAINDEIDKIKARLDIIEADINSINQQIAAINGSIDDLKAVDAALQTLIADLEAEAANLKAELDANAEADAAKKKALEDKITALETLIATLQAKDAELDQKIADLKTYVDNELANYATTDWANATFATLTQYLEIQTTIETIKAEIKDDYTVAIKAAVNALEDKIEDWVNKKLEQPLRDIAALQAALSALTNDVVTDEELADAVAAQKEALEKAVENLKAAYEAAIKKAIEDNNGVIDAAVSAAITAATNNLQSEIDSIKSEITSIKNRLDKLETDFANRIQSLTYIPTHTDGKATMAYNTTSGKWEAELSYFVTPKSVVGNIKQEHLSAKGVYTASTRSVDLVDLPVTDFSADMVQGTITVTLSGQYLSDAFYAGMADASVFLMISDGNSECLSVPVGLVPVNKLLGDVTDPAQAAKGDVALVDGSFVSKAKITEMTDAQKANVAGIVFWTTADMNTDANAQTPAKLTDDVIMAADFPNCTHGLIVSLKNVSTSCVWQSTYTNVASWQTSTFTAANKNDYKSIASGIGADGNINYILGYQNTKLLKAYNAQCEEDNKVLPVSSLDEFSERNPAPAHTTGWFIPSVKELHMLCYKDVDNVWTESGTNKVDTKNVINTSLNAVAGDSFENNYYWSSTEGAGLELVAFAVYFDLAIVYDYYKGNAAYVRAVCAY